MEDVCRQYRACDIKISLGDGCECMNVEGIVCWYMLVDGEVFRSYGDI